MGIDAGAFYQKFHLLCEYASGYNGFGQLALGVEAYITKHFPLSVSWRRANQDGEHAVVVQLTYTPE